MNFEGFLTHYILNAPQMMWFLGAGASRSAGMPSATDIIWDLKRKYYCLKENQDITDNELSNEAIQKKIQTYCDSAGCPAQWSEQEYAYYFKLVFGDEAILHQKYLEEKLNPSTISINSGHRILAALMAMKLCRLIFTTNFDEVIETSHAFMTGEDLHAFNLNGSYAALNALNNEKFPIYAKMHGDFRYVEMKNLPDQLKSNDAEIEKCFINACSRYGMIVVGYSGRDINVMKAFDQALENDNAFPKGLFWINSVQGVTFPAVTELISKAKTKGINAYIIEADTFDSLLNSIWKQVNNKPAEFDKKIRRSIFEIPKIPKYSSAGNLPLIRMNAFPISSMPTTCRAIETISPMTMTEFSEKITGAKSRAVMIKEQSIYAWGSMEEIHKIIPSGMIASSTITSIENKLNSFKQNTLINAFYNRALSVAVIMNKPLKLRRRKERFYAVVSTLHDNFKSIEPILKKGLATYNFPTQKMVEPQKLAGAVPGVQNAYWMECVEISIEKIDGKFYLLLTPDIWIEPAIKRKDARDFITEKKKNRYNRVQNTMLDAWKTILLGLDKQVTLKVFQDDEPNNAVFSLDTTSAYTYRQTNE